MITPRSRLTTGAVASHYDELDGFYREIWGEHVHHGFWKNGDESPEVAVRQLVELVADHGAIGAGTRVCDIGCGYGATARMLARERQAEVTGVTLSEAQYRFASSLPEHPQNPRYLLADWLRNDLPSAAFDTAISVESSEHMPDKAAFFAQAYRVLRPGGRLVICAWLAAEDPSGSQIRWLLEPICREGRMPGMGSESEYRTWLNDAGFVLENFADLTPRVKKTWPICVGRFLLKLVRRPTYARFLFNRHAQNRIFALTIARIWLAYEIGAMRYGIFQAIKPG